MSNTTFKHQIVFYLICGAISTSVDFMIYFSLYKLDFQVDLAKGFSFMIATFISYFLNKHITFQTKNKSFYEFLWFILVHILAMLCDVAMNRVMLFFLGLILVGHVKVILAFVIATGVSVIINFLGQRYFVFRKVSI